MRQLFTWVVLISACPMSFTEAAPPGADERYYMIMFAFEGRPNLPRSAHTFATFIKVGSDKSAQAGKPPIELHTISWTSVAPIGQVLLRPVERGVNRSLANTLDLAKAIGAEVSAWGPYEIKKDLYDRALKQIAHLSSGQVHYKAVDVRFRPDGATNCFHAISDIVDGPLLDTGAAFGVSASQLVLEHLAPWIINPRVVDRELRSRLGLEGIGILYRDEVAKK
jgi:hypothetical protein